MTKEQFIRDLVRTLVAKDVTYGDRQPALLHIDYVQPHLEPLYISMRVRPCGFKNAFRPFQVDLNMDEGVEAAVSTIFTQAQIELDYFAAKCREAQRVLKLKQAHEERRPVDDWVDDLLKER